jgi:phenylacetate 2-hydroxylase
MTEEIRRCRKVAMRALGKPSCTGYYPLLEPSSVDLVGNVSRKGENGGRKLEIYPYLR